MKDTLIYELIGEYRYAEEISYLCFQFIGCSKFNGKICVIDFENGTLEVYPEDSKDMSVKENTFRIHPTLVKE